MKVAVIAGNEQSLINFRGSLIQELVRLGHEVVACAPEGGGSAAVELAAWGVRFAPIQFSRAGVNPLSDILSERRMEAMFVRERPAIVLAATIKPVVYGIPAAYRAAVSRRYALVTGLGAAFYTDGVKGHLLSVVATRLYRRALRRCTRVIVQNRDIAEFFLRRRIVDNGARITVVPGSGVDTTYFSAKAVSAAAAPSFLLLGRLLRDKGVGEYVEAAREVRRRLPAARFLLVGDFDSNPASITEAQLDAWKKEGVIEHRPFVSDVRAFLEGCTVYVLPSYHEGLPRSVLEAMATARPIITTDAIGCRDTIFGVAEAASRHTDFRSGENGLLVPVKSGSALAAAMLHLAENPCVAAAMGRRGREIAEQHFDVCRINALMLEAMGIEGVSKRSK